VRWLDLGIRSLSQPRDVDGFRHRAVARIVRMQMIAGIERGAQTAWMAGIAQDGIEVDDGVERTAVRIHWFSCRRRCSFSGLS